MVRMSSWIAVVVLLAAPTRADESWTWPETTENLTVLPSRWTGERLRPVMLGFSRALGVSCAHCHVGEEGASLSTFDFVSDENPNKDRARDMLRMLGSINDHLESIEPSGDERVNMWCHTCHRGRPRPMTLGEELGEVLRAKGPDAALGHYDELRSSFFGRGAYDFSEDALNAIGYATLETGDVEAAIRIFERNASHHPDSANAWDSLAEALFEAVRIDESASHYERSLALDPGNENAVQMLEKIRSLR